MSALWAITVVVSLGLLFLAVGTLARIATALEEIRDLWRTPDGA